MRVSIDFVSRCGLSILTEGRPGAAIILACPLPPDYQCHIVFRKTGFSRVVCSICADRVQSFGPNDSRTGTAQSAQEEGSGWFGATKSVASPKRAVRHGRDGPHRLLMWRGSGCGPFAESQGKPARTTQGLSPGGSGTMVTVPMVASYATSRNSLSWKAVLRLAINSTAKLSLSAGGNTVAAVKSSRTSNCGVPRTVTSEPLNVASPPMKVSLGAMVPLTARPAEIQRRDYLRKKRNRCRQAVNCLEDSRNQAALARQC